MGPPWGSLALATAVLRIEPRSMSACVTVYRQEYDHVSPTSSRPSPSVSPDCNTGAHNGSVTETDDSVTLPSFNAVTVYVIGSPAAETDGTDGDLATVTCGPGAAVTVADPAPDTAAPRG